MNGISAGPIKTLAAAGIGGFGKILKFVEKQAPLRRNVTTEEVGNAAAFLCSDLASGITGEITYVDAGFNTAGGRPDRIERDCESKEKPADDHAGFFLDTGATVPVPASSCRS